MAGLYLHIPFCVRKCVYCDFYSVETGSGSLPRRLAGYRATDNSRFLDALEMELAALPPGFRPETIFVGGGTPTELSDQDFARLCDMTRRRVDLSAVVEWTCESNPGTLTKEKAALLRATGVNRVSLGVQSFDARALEFLGRIHSAAEAVAGYDLLRAAGFDNLNLDLIFGVPGSTRDTLESDLRRAIDLGPEHISCYSLTFEEDTPLHAMREKGLVSEVNDEDMAAAYEMVRTMLRAGGYEQYEISNFARPGRACRHNLLYWGPGEYIGCGPAAHSHWEGVRYGNVRNLHAYCDRLLSGRTARAFEEKLERERKARETLVMGLRRLEGVSRETFRKQTGFDYEQLIPADLAWAFEEGWLDASEDRLRLTEKSLFTSNAILAELV